MDAVIGTAVFVAGKFFGYFFYFLALNRKRGEHHAYALAIYRLLLGVGFGAAIWGVFSSLHAQMPLIYFTAILLGRVAAWTLIIRWGYRSAGDGRQIAYIAGGTVISYLVDIPVFFGIISAIGGIC